MKFIVWRRVGILATALLLLTGVIASTAGEISSKLINLGTTLLWVLALTLLAHLLQTIAWKMLIKASPLKLFWLKLGGEALDSLSPFVPLKGSTYQFGALAKKGVLPSDSLIAYRGLKWLARLIAVSVFLLLGGLLTTIPPLGRWGLVLLGIAGLAGLGRSLGKRQVFVPLYRLLPFGSSPATVGTLEETDRGLATLFQRSRGKFSISLGLILVSEWVLAGEVLLLGSRLFPQFPLATALLITGASSGVLFAFQFLPGGFGLLELVVGGLLQLIMGPTGFIAGVTLVLARRIRALVWWILGLAAVGNPAKLFR